MKCQNGVGYRVNPEHFIKIVANKVVGNLNSWCEGLDIFRADTNEMKPNQLITFINMQLVLVKELKSHIIQVETNLIKCMHRVSQKKLLTFNPVQA